MGRYYTRPVITSSVEGILVGETAGACTRQFVLPVWSAHGLPPLMSAHGRPRKGGEVVLVEPSRDPATGSSPSTMCPCSNSSCSTPCGSAPRSSTQPSACVAPVAPTVNSCGCCDAGSAGSLCERRLLEGAARGAGLDLGWGGRSAGTNGRAGTSIWGRANRRWNANALRFHELASALEDDTPSPLAHVGGDWGLRSWLVTVASAPVLCSQGGLFPPNLSDQVTMSRHFKKQQIPNRNRAADHTLAGLSWKRIQLEQPQQLIIANRGGDIRETNYFDSSMARQGMFFLSWNASVGRILVPDTQRRVLREMATATECVVTRGRLNGADTLELMFDDRSDAPYVLYLCRQSTDRWFASDDRPFTVAAWTRDGKAGEWVGRYRTADELPCLRPWGR